jgi:hypothetical protein
MSTQNDLGFRTFQASGAISAYLVVDVQSDGTIKAAAGGVTQGIGVLQQDVADAGYGGVKLWTAPGTFMAQVSGTAITPATEYAVITGGYIGTRTATTWPTAVAGLQAGVASAGIIVEFIGKL